MHYRSCKRKELTLACGEVVTSLSYLLVKSVGELVDEVVCVYVLAGLEDLLVGDGVITKNNIGTNRSGEEEHVLKHLTEVTAQGRELDIFNIKLFAALTSPGRKCDTNQSFPESVCFILELLFVFFFNYNIKLVLIHIKFR